MKKWILPIIVVLTLLFTGLGIYVTQAQKPAETAVYTPQPVSIPLNADKILELVNVERKKVGVAPLVSDPRLVQSAQTKADDMAINNYFDHVNPTTGKHGYEYIPVGMCRNAGENISRMDDPSGDNNLDAINGWMNSKPHHDAMLDPTKSLAGVAVDGKYIVMHLCEPK